MVERGGLENRCPFTGTQGSNPCLSAIYSFRQICTQTGRCRQLQFALHMAQKNPPAEHSTEGSITDIARLVVGRAIGLVAT